MAERTCWNCVYVSCEPGRCLRHQPPRCANHPQWPGRLHDVPGVPCRNYERKPVEPPDDIRRIPLGHGKYAYVDAEDYEWLSQWKWRLRNGYAARRDGAGKTIFMHRQIMRAPEGRLVDHMDGNKRHNYRSNLRLCSSGENVHNAAKRAGTGSRFKGVYRHAKSGKWCAQIHFGGQPTHLGCFADEVEAARAYDRAAVERFGAFARPNFPEDWPVERRQEVHAQWLKANGRRKGARARAKCAGRSGGKGHKVTAVRPTRRKGRAAVSKAPARRGRRRATVPGGSARRR